MRIDQLRLTNFKGFASFEVGLDPQFNLLVGDNASGKTSLLDAIKIGLDSWFIGMKGVAGIGSIGQNEVHMASHRHEDSVSFEKQFPSRVEFVGSVFAKAVCWERELGRDGGRTTTVGSKELSCLAEDIDRRVRSGQDVTLPLVCAFGTERLWYESPEQKRSKEKKTGIKWPSRFDGYRNCTAFEIQETDLLEWFREQVSASQQRGSKTVALEAVKAAVVSCVEGAKDLYHDARYGDLVVVTEAHGHQLFRSLSDGQRLMVSMIGDLARRAVTLNPHLGFGALSETPGVVSIDELDMHLHPKWQRRVIQDLKRTFPKVQFIATTHSPQLVGEALPHEIRILENGVAITPDRSFGMDSSRVLVELMRAKPRNGETDDLLHRMSDEIDHENLDEAKSTLVQVEEKLGKDDPEVTGAHTLIHLLEASQ